MTLALRPRANDRRLRRPCGLALRMLTAPARSLPNFLVIGAMKSGTSSLFHYLCQHPSVARPMRKETHYFDLAQGAGKGLRWYRAHFPLRPVVGPPPLVGEATPGYLFDARAAGKIAELGPVKLIAILRDPVERAISHYRHEVRMGREYLPIEEAMRLEERRLTEATQPGTLDAETYAHASYKKRGLYLEQLERYWHHFPRSDVLVLGTRDLLERPAQTVARALRFLGAPEREVSYRFARKNVAATRDEVPSAVRDELAAYFEAPNRGLSLALGQPLRW